MSTPDAETVYRKVRERVPAISLDTVYRTLRLFEDKGVIVRLGMVRDRARFDANVSCHPHFVCTRCGQVLDVDDDRVGGLSVPREISGLGHVESVYVEIRGLCQSCRR